MEKTPDTSHHTKKKTKAKTKMVRSKIEKNETTASISTTETRQKAWKT